ncbi:hypothetical protein ACFQZU_19225, partial [Streptomonospora algeriensis]
LVAGAAVGMALAAAPAHADGHHGEDGSLIVNAQKQTQEAEAVSENVNANFNDSEAEAEAESALEIVVELL